MEIQVRVISPRKKPFNGKPTFLQERILTQFFGQPNKVPAQFRKNPNIILDYVGKFPAKVHHLVKRTSAKPGSKIAFVVNRKKKDEFYFAPMQEVLEIEEFELVVITKGVTTIYGFFFNGQFTCQVRKHAGVFVSCPHIVQTFTANEGYDHFSKFLAEHEKGGKFKLIHWTDTIRYTPPEEEQPSK